jgi:hypothetical protein
MSCVVYKILLRANVFIFLLFFLLFAQEKYSLRKKLKLKQNYLKNSKIEADIRNVKSISFFFHFM